MATSILKLDHESCAPLWPQVVPRCLLPTCITLQKAAPLNPGQVDLSAAAADELVLGLRYESSSA